MNDGDAVFCANCGRPLGGRPPETADNRVYLIALLFVPIILIAAAIGYYKFYLPNGIAAEVNGELIRLSELDAAAARMQGWRGAAPADLRYRALKELIAERLVLQEARKAGVAVSKDEIAAAVAEARTASGLDDAAFQQAMKSIYGSEADYEKDLDHRLIINRFIAQKVVAPGTDPKTAYRMVSRWLQDLPGKATVRVALTEQLSGPGFGCCNVQGGQPPAMRGNAGYGCAMGAGGQAAAGPTKEAVDAGLRYWHGKYGPGEVTTRAIDLGRYAQVDIIRDNKIIGTLVYQNGTITEQQGRKNVNEHVQ